MYEITEDIIREAAQGDRRAFKEIYDAYSDFVYRLALGMLQQEQDAEEVTQDVFIQIHQKLVHFRFESSLKTWIYRIAVNTTLNHRKKKSRERKKILNFRNQAQQEGADVSYQSLYKEDYNQAISRLLEALNPEQRICIILRSVENLNYEEIAEVLKVNVNTVRSRVMRAREKMMSLKEVILSEI